MPKNVRKQIGFVPAERGNLRGKRQPITVTKLDGSVWKYPRGLKKAGRHLGGPHPVWPEWTLREDGWYERT